MRAFLTRNDGVIDHGNSDVSHSIKGRYTSDQCILGLDAEHTRGLVVRGYVEGVVAVEELTRNHLIKSPLLDSATYPICRTFFLASAIPMSSGEMELGSTKSLVALANPSFIFVVILE